MRKDAKIEYGYHGVSVSITDYLGDELRFVTSPYNRCDLPPDWICTAHPVAVNRREIHIARGAQKQTYRITMKAR